MSLNTYPGNPFPPSTEQMHEGDNEDLQAQINAIKDGTDIDSFGDVESALATKTDLELIAPEFDATSGIYAVGDLVTYQGKLYEFTSAHETAGDWDIAEVAEKTVSDEIDTLKSGLTNLANGSIYGSITVLQSRCEILSGSKVYYIGNFAVLNIKIKSLITATNSPSMLSIDKNADVECALSCVDITSGINNAIDGAVPCAIGTQSHIFLKEVATNGIYAISGIVKVSAS